VETTLRADPNAVNRIHRRSAAIDTALARRLAWRRLETRAPTACHT
jgi:hypothetical protein